MSEVVEHVTVRPLRADACVRAGDQHDGGSAFVSVFRGEATVVVHILLGQNQLRLDLTPDIAIELGAQMCGAAREIEYKT